MVIEAYILKRIETLQEELERLKKTLLRRDKEQPISLRGLWRGVDFGDEEIEEAKRSLFKDADNDAG